MVRRFSLSFAEIATRRNRLLLLGFAPEANLDWKQDNPQMHQHLKTQPVQPGFAAASFQLVPEVCQIPSRTFRRFRASKSADLRFLNYIKVVERQLEL